MKIFHASLTMGLIKMYHEIFKTLLNVLISPATVSRPQDFLKAYRQMLDEIILDSGAWSMVKGTFKYSLDEYISFLRHVGVKVNRYFNLDAEFSTDGLEANYENQILLENAGFIPVPVVHNFHNKEIEFYCTCGKYDWIALGSSQASNFKEVRYAVNKAKRANPEIKIHWFGGSKFEWLTELPIAACDTSSWAATGSYGNINFWNEDKPGINKTDQVYIGGRMEGCRRSKYHYVTYPWRANLEQYLRDTFHFDKPFEALLSGAENMQLVNLRFYVELEQRINDERRRKGIEL